MKKQSFAKGAALIMFACAVAATGSARAQDACMLGELRLFSGNFAPKTWEFAAGQTLPIKGNEALFGVLGSVYGGDGRTNFSLPDLRARTAVGAGTGPGLTPRKLGERFGAADMPLEAANMVGHVHTASTEALLHGTMTTASTAAVRSNALASNTTARIYSTSDANIALNENMAQATTTVAQTGAARLTGASYQPFLGMNYIICTIGFYPYSTED